MEEAPVRIVSLVPSQTELLADLGLGDKVVGITKFCVHPREWFESKVRVGGTKDVSLSKVASLKPDLIIVNKEENLPEQVEELTTIAPVWVSNVKDVLSAIIMVERIGNLTDTEPRANEIIENINQSFRQLKPLSREMNAVYLIWRRPYMAAGSDTFISDMMAQCGLANAVTADRYPKLSKNDLRSLAPEVVLLSSEPYTFKAQHLEEMKAILPNAKVLLVDGEMFSWYGSRMMHAAPYLQKLITGLEG
jgi:ABC-type Fe3+-hydroxamate transport system substrate-binding protein